MSDGTVEEVLTKIFRVCYVNGDGIISSKEMTKLIKDMMAFSRLRIPILLLKT